MGIFLVKGWGKMFSIVVKKNGMFILKLMQFFQYCCMLLAFLFAIRTVKKNSIVAYMKGFYWYSVVAMASAFVGIFVLFNTGVTLEKFTMANKLSFVFHYIFLSTFICRVLKNKTTKRVYIFIFFFFLAIILYATISTLYVTKSLTVNYTTNFFLIVFCLFYYYDLFDGVPKQNLFHEPAFWIVSGLFLCLTITVPLNTVRSFIEANSSGHINLYLGSIASFSYGLMHLFFIKAYLCSTNPKRVL